MGTPSSQKGKSKFRALSAEQRRIIHHRIRNAALPQHMKMSLRSLSPGKAVMTMPWNDNHAQYQGLAHGGAVSALADTVATMAALTVVDEKTDVVTIEFKINFLAPLIKSPAQATARVVKAGRRVTVVEAEVTGRRSTLCATGTFTLLNFATS